MSGQKKDTQKKYENEAERKKAYRQVNKNNWNGKRLYSDKLINQISHHYLVSKSEATDYVEIMTQTECTAILQLYGYTEAEIKTMLKGVKK